MLVLLALLILLLILVELLEVLSSGWRVRLWAGLLVRWLQSWSWSCSRLWLWMSLLSRSGSRVRVDRRRAVRQAGQHAVLRHLILFRSLVLRQIRV